MSRTVASSRTARVVALAVFVALLVTGANAFAVESASEGAGEDHGAQTIEDIGADNEISSKYLPEETELPPFQRFMYVPLFAVGILVIVALVLGYLRWQPRFAEERRSKRRR